MATQSQKISGFTILVGTSGPHKYRKTNTHTFVFVCVYIHTHNIKYVYTGTSKKY